LTSPGLAGTLFGAIADSARTLTGKKLGRAINERAVGAVNSTAMPSYKKGGRVKRTGLARVHKGEVVLTASAAKTLKKIIKQINN
jgi:hypothetical protein